MTPRGLWVLVPLKNMSRGKERLAPALDAAMRRELIGAMARDVLEALLEVPVPARRIVLVSDDDDVALLAERYGVGIYRPAPVAADPLNAALEEARRAVLARGAAHLLVLHADLPLAGSAAVRALVAAHVAQLRAAGAPLVTLVSDRAGEGTNCLLTTPPDALGYRFGTDSRQRHRQQALLGGVRCVEFACDGLSQDIDHPDDLVELVRVCQRTDNASAPNTSALLLGSGGTRVNVFSR